MFIYDCAISLRTYWHASHSPPFRIASMEQAVFSAAVYSFLAAAGVAGVVSKRGVAFIAVVEWLPPASPLFWPPLDPSFTAPRISFFTPTVAFSMFEAPRLRR